MRKCKVQGAHGGLEDTDLRGWSTAMQGVSSPRKHSSVKNITTFDDDHHSSFSLDTHEYESCDCSMARLNHKTFETERTLSATTLESVPLPWGVWSFVLLQVFV